jgi:hypothetical protein
MPATVPSHKVAVYLWWWCWMGRISSARSAQEEGEGCRSCPFFLESRGGVGTQGSTKVEQ